MADIRSSSENPRNICSIGNMAKLQLMYGMILRMLICSNTLRDASASSTPQKIIDNNASFQQKVLFCVNLHKCLFIKKMCFVETNVVARISHHWRRGWSLDCSIFNKSKWFSKIGMKAFSKALFCIKLHIIFKQHMCINTLISW